MSIVFDHVEGVVQRAPEAHDDAAAADAAAAPVRPDPEELARELERVQRRHERLRAD
jgi:hypothetical protein